MSVRSTPEGTGTPAAYGTYGDDDRGYGWVAFAGVLLLILGTINTIEGIAAIGNAHFFTHNTHYVFGSMTNWGWIVLCIGVIELLVGLGVFAKNQLARWTGVGRHTVWGNGEIRMEHRRAEAANGASAV